MESVTIIHRPVSGIVGKVQKRCFYCGCDLTQSSQKTASEKIPTMATRDHVIPKTNGGTSTKKNIVWSCYGCNREKAALSIEEYRILRMFRMGLLHLKNPLIFPGEKAEYKNTPKISFFKKLKIQFKVILTEILVFTSVIVV